MLCGKILIVLVLFDFVGLRTAVLFENNEGSPGYPESGLIEGRLSMKKSGIKYLILAVILFISTLYPQTINVKAAGVPNRVINVVYDDSGSMIYSDAAKAKVDTWCQAKYSMEVFASMLGQEDTMNIYVMSDFDDGPKADGPYLSLRGKDGALHNVNEVHNMLTAHGWTPFEAIEKAYDDLRKETNCEKWLVVLTDGDEFQHGGNTTGKKYTKENIEPMESFFQQKDSDVNVIYLAIGTEAVSITGKPSDNLFSLRAESNDQILSQITDICSRIFKMDKLKKVDISSGKIEFDVSMSELIVFAQGDDVSISGITGADGKKIGGEKVDVKYSEVATSKVYEPGYSLMNKYDDPVIDTGLVGCIATYRGEFDPGEYIVDVSNAKTLEVYYKPHVDIMLYLIDKNGEEIAYDDGVKAGEYTIKFGFINPATKESLPTSELLGDIHYEAEIGREGGGNTLKYSDGATIELNEGTYHISAQAEFLKIFSISTEDVPFEVYNDKEIEFSVTEAPTYQLTKEGFVNDNVPMTVHATMGGQELTEGQWQYLTTPELTTSWLADKRVELKIEKSENVGDFLIYPSLQDGKTTIGDYGDIEFSLVSETVVGKSTWKGAVEGIIDIDDQRSWFERNIDKVIKGAIAAAVLWLICGYLPIFKHRLPKKLKKNPVVTTKPKMPGKKGGEYTGKFEKKRITVILPYVPERGVIRYVPKGVIGARTLEVKAVGSNRMEIVNTASFEGNKTVKINGDVVTSFKGRKVPGGVAIEFEDPLWKYTCVPTQGKTK